LWRDALTKAKFNSAYIAHIVADKPTGPRGDKSLSKLLKNDISNLMLLCDPHHRLVDIADVQGHPVERLQEMKKRHERRIDIQTSLGDDKQSHILHYGANIGTLNAKLSWQKSYEAMSPQRYPADDNAIELSMKNSSFTDKEPTFWEIERENLRRQFTQKVEPRLTSNIGHLSVFALASQPLLIELGRLLSDVSAMDVYQHQKEPMDSWCWRDEQRHIPYKIVRPSTTHEQIALNLSLSANIDNQRIYSVLGHNVSIWVVTIEEPYNDFLKTRDQLSDFRRNFRLLLNEIKLSHGQNAILNIFPAAPVSIAVEIGRVWMPKADLTLRIFDQNSAKGGFVQAFDINSF